MILIETKQAYNSHHVRLKIFKDINRYHPRQFNAIFLGVYVTM